VTRDVDGQLYAIGSRNTVLMPRSIRDQCLDDLRYLEMCLFLDTRTSHDFEEMGSAARYVSCDQDHSFPFNCPFLFIFSRMVRES